LGLTVVRVGQDATWVAHPGAKHDACGQVSIHNFTLEQIPFEKMARGAAAKRALDLIGVAAAGLLLAIPFAVGAVAVWRTMGAPVFITQPRVGRDGRVFEMHKLRTMDAAADTMATLPDDDRVTPVGAWLRRLHLDEAPQLWNILKGDMSLVGPRPEQPHYVADYIRQMPAFELRTKVLPGLTGWAQLRSGYAADVPETALKLAHDLYYLENWSLAFDLLILVETVLSFGRGKGAR
jgi:lipopolysaccharide/colanic/teichoic acid biosynthesis glycosyltransferase